MKTIGQLNLKRERLSFLAFNGSELRSAGAPAMATAAQAFGHGVLTHSASSRKRVTLPKDQVWRLEPPEVPSSIRVLSGALWITEDGDNRDHVIQADSRLGGQRFQFSRQAGALISALEDSELEVA
jgi:hypothetical protein